MQSLGSNAKSTFEYLKRWFFFFSSFEEDVEPKILLNVSKDSTSSL